MSLFGNRRRFASQDKQALAKATGRSNSKGKGHYFIKKKDEVGRGCFEQKSAGGRRGGSRVMTVFHGLSCQARKEVFLPPVGVVKQYWTCQVVRLLL